MSPPRAPTAQGTEPRGQSALGGVRGLQRRLGLHGEAGIGKTALLDQTLAAAAAASASRLATSS